MKISRKQLKRLIIEQLGLAEETTTESETAIRDESMIPPTLDGVYRSIRSLAGGEPLSIMTALAEDQTTASGGEEAIEGLIVFVDFHKTYYEPQENFNQVLSQLESEFGPEYVESITDGVDHIIKRPFEVLDANQEPVNLESKSVGGLAPELLSDLSKIVNSESFPKQLIFINAG